MSSPSKDTEEPSSSTEVVDGVAGGSAGGGGGGGASEAPRLRPPAKRRLSGAAAVIEISDTESDDSDVCAVTSYQATADEVKRIRGDDYSSSSSSSDYSSDSESAWEDDSVLVEDQRPVTRAVRAQLFPRANRMDDPKISPHLKSPEVISKLKSHWKSHTEHHSGDVSLTSSPFRLCRLHRFLADPDIINNIVDDMNTLDWTRKKMDLYEYHQTADLATLTWQRGIRGIYELLKTDVMNWVSDVTGLELRTVSAACSLHGPGDHLLAHDDRLADRRVAFILYLAPWRPTQPTDTVHNGGHHDIQVYDACGGWAAHLGGALQLLALDGARRPAGVARALLPTNNTLAFFAVGEDTFHQVGEVVSLELPRLSINGWFHGPEPAPAAPAEPAEPDQTEAADGEDGAEAPDRPDAEPCPLLEPHNEVVLLPQWVESTYMSPRNRVHIQQQMERESEVCLRAFLQPARLQAVLAALRHQDVPWERCGPADRRQYSRVPRAWAALAPEGGAGAGAEAEGLEAVRALLRLAGSAAFCRLLADCTDLVLTRYTRLELQRWAPGDYTLLPPRSVYQEARLEAVLYLGVPARALCGGATTYVAPEEAGGDGALVTLPPVDNALNLVYCDAGAAGFTKYLSKLCMKPDEHFYVLTCTYRE